MTSTYVLTGAATVLAYTASKVAIVSVSSGMTKELVPHGITVNTIAPGNFDTDMSKG